MNSVFISKCSCEYKNYIYNAELVALAEEGTRSLAHVHPCGVPHSRIKTHQKGDTPTSSEIIWK